MSSDFKLQEMRSLMGVTMDFLLLPNGVLDEREQLATSVRVALGTDRLSQPQEILPDPDSLDRRGWWADLDAEVIWGGWPIGCRNWLLMRAKINDAMSFEGSTLERARQYTIEALQPLIDRRICSQIEVTAARTELERIEVTATIYRGPLPEIELRYQLLWEEIITPLPAPAIDNTVYIPRRNLALSMTAPTVSTLTNIKGAGAWFAASGAVVTHVALPIAARFTGAGSLVAHVGLPAAAQFVGAGSLIAQLSPPPAVGGSAGPLAGSVLGGRTLG
jgi:phage gp46-like protein